MVLYGWSPPSHWGHAQAPRQGGPGHEGQVDADHGTGDQADMGSMAPGSDAPSVCRGGV
jgi:hypothetical protein